MTSITYVGLDVHTTNYTAACYRFETDNTFAVAELKPKAEEIVKYLGVCPPRKNRQKTYAKNRMKRMTNMI